MKGKVHPRSGPKGPMGA